MSGIIRLFFKPLFDSIGTNGFYYAIWSRGGALLKRSTNALAAVSLPGRPLVGTSIHTRMRAGNREAFQFTEIGECILAGRLIATDLNALHRFAWWLVVAGGAVLALGLGGGWLMASRALRPVADISTAASRISAGHLSERIDVDDTDSELGRLAGVLNSTFARLEAAFAQQEQFTADASHELRTPIAVLISEAQTTAKSASQPAPEPDLAVITVADTGPGISTDDLPHVFERFYRADKSRARAQGRSGLGLAICKAVVEAHGGSIEVSSELGAGSQFTVKLPT